MTYSHTEEDLIHERYLLYTFWSLGSLLGVISFMELFFPKKPIMFVFLLPFIYFTCLNALRMVGFFRTEKRNE
jgi:predicted branched-subunit amino acid permease